MLPGLVVEAIKTACTCLGMAAARLIEPTSKAGTPGALLSEIGWPGTAQHNTLQACLVRARERGYRESLLRVLFDHITTTRGLALCLQV